MKRLRSVETLGSTSALNSDKTGTLTLNQMTAVQMAIVGRRYTISGDGYSTIGQISHAGGQPDVPARAVPAADGPVRRRRGPRRRARRRSDRGRARRPRGQGRRRSGADARALPARRDPAVRRGLQDDGHVPRDEGRERQGRHPRLHQGRAGPAPGPRGARPRPGRHGGPGRPSCATPTSPRTSAWARMGLRVMATGQKDFDPATFDPNADLLPLIDGLTLLAIVGIVDPPRPAAKAAIAEAHAAGIQVRMITGDHAVTAEAIAHQLGIEGRAITGAEFRAMSDDEAMRQIDGIGVIARVSPEDKVHLVDILQQEGPRRRDDRRWRERRAGAQEGRHRHRHGHHRHGGLQAGRGDDPDRRQLRDDRQGGRRWAAPSTTTCCASSASRWPACSGSSRRSSGRRCSTSSAASRSCRSRRCGSTSRSTCSRPSASATASRARG